MDDATVEILLQVKKDGVAAFAEASALATNLKEAIQSLNRQTAEGVPVTEAARRAIGELSRGLLESGLAADVQKNQIQDLRQALTRYVEVVTAGMPPQEAYLAVLAFQTEAMRRTTDATNDNTAATARNNAVKGVTSSAGGFGGSFGFLGGIGGAVAGAALAMGPFIQVIAAAIVMMTAFLVSGGAMVALLGSMSLGFLGLGGAMVLLANRAGAINGPMSQFKADFKDMADQLGRWAAPIATLILQFGDKLLPLIEYFGSSVETWLEVRVPGALSAMGVAIRNLTPDLTSFGRFLGNVFDQVSPQIAPMFEDIARLGIGAFQGLISNLVNLSQWFEQRLPTYGPIMQQIFNGIGNGVQFLATNFGKLSDWFAGHWPGIQKQADDFKTTFGNVFQSLHVIQGLPLPDGAGFWHGLAVVLAIISAALVDVVQFLDIVIVQSTSALPAALQTIANNIANWQPPAWLAWLFAWDSAGGSNKPPFGNSNSTVPPAGFATAVHKHAPQITQNNYYTNQTDPTKTAAAVTRSLRRVLNPS